MGKNIQDGDFVLAKMMLHHFPHFPVCIFAKALVRAQLLRSMALTAYPNGRGQQLLIQYRLEQQIRRKANPFDNGCQKFKDELTWIGETATSWPQDLIGI